MTRVAAAESLANLRVGTVPEAPQIVGDLLRPHVGAKQVKDHRNATAGQARRLEKPEHLLDPDREHRRLALLAPQLVTDPTYPVLGMLAHGVEEAEVAATLGLEPEWLRARRWAMLSTLAERRSAAVFA